MGPMKEKEEDWKGKPQAEAKAKDNTGVSHCHIRNPCVNEWLQRAGNYREKTRFQRHHMTAFLPCLAATRARILHLDPHLDVG